LRFGSNPEKHDWDCNVIANTAVIFPGVILGPDVTIEDYCVIGVGSSKERTVETMIGEGARIRAHTIIYAGNVIGKRFQTGNKTNIREYNKIGDDVSIGTLTVIEHHVSIGDGVRIHSQAFIPEHSVLEPHAWIGPNAVLTNARYPNTETAKTELSAPRVCTGARVGANATILPGVHIGRGAIVGAGSVVTHEVAANTIVAGNPAMLLREVKNEKSKLP
jgi:acetyltransferase-like isoleucine patch superfamily enzyme